MAAGWKLRKLAEERQMTQRELVIWALSLSRNYAEAGAKLGISKAGVRKAIERLDIPTERRTVISEQERAS